MKKTLTTLAACVVAMSTVALAETVDIALHTGSPSAQNIGNNQNDNMVNIMGKHAARTPGIWLSANNGNIGLTNNGAEGAVTAVTTAEGTTYSVTTWSRSGAGGESVTQVIADTGITAGYNLTSLTFSYASITGKVTSGYYLGVGVFTSSGAEIAKETESRLGASGGSVVLSLDTPLVWDDSYRIVATLYQPGGSDSVSVSTTSGIKLQAEVSAPVTLTATAVPMAVTTGTIDAPGMLTLKLTDVNSLAGISGLNLSLSSEDDWTAITAGKDLGGYVQLAFVDGEGNALTYDPAALPVTIHGYAGVPGQRGKYLLGYIPEPTTAMLSLLAMAGLAARRRRK